MKKKYIVTGGHGFIGSYIVDKLIDENHQVIVLDNNSNGRKPIINSKTKNYNIDVSNLNELNNLVDIFYGSSGIFHCAALIDVQESIDDPIKYEKNNTLGTLNVLEAAAKAKVKRLVYSSSAAVYGDNTKTPIKENCPTNPISPYGLQKYYGERLCSIYSKLYSLETCCLRYFNAFGGRQKISGAYATVIGIFKYQIKNNLPLTIRGDGEQKRDFIHAKELANANYLAMTSKEKFCGEVFNLGSGESLSINKIASFFDSEKKFISAVKEPKESLADITKAKSVLNWSPNINIKKWIEKKI